MMLMTLNILGSIVGSPYFGKVPYSLKGTLFRFHVSFRSGNGVQGLGLRAFRIRDQVLGRRLLLT